MSTPDIQSPSPFLPQYEDSLPIPFLPPSTLSPKKGAVSGSPVPNDDQQNPNKRQKADIARGTRLLSLAFKQSLGSFSTSDERHAAAVKTARNLDEQRHLPFEDIVVSVRESLHSSLPEQYNLSNFVELGERSSLIQRTSLPNPSWIAMLFRCVLF